MYPLRVSQQRASEVHNMRDDAFVMTHWKRPSHRAAVDGRWVASMKNRSFPGKNDVAVAYEISGTLRVDFGQDAICPEYNDAPASGGTSGARVDRCRCRRDDVGVPTAGFPDQARYAAADEQRAMKARMEALHP